MIKSHKRNSFVAFFIIILISKTIQMRKTLFISICCILFSITDLLAQVISSNPKLVTTGSTNIEIIFDASQGNRGMMGAADCYAHTGVITNISINDKDWRYASGWKDNSPKYKMQSLGSNKWKLIITPDITEYYGITDAKEIVTRLAFVFRNADASKEGKNSDGSDIYLNVYQDGLAINFISPVENQIYRAKEPVKVNITSTISADLKLFKDDVNSTPLKHIQSGQELMHDLSLPVGEYNLIAQASLGSDVVRDTTYICISKNPDLQIKPVGIKDGINLNPDGSVTFCLFAPDKESVFLLGDFNNFKPDNEYLLHCDISASANYPNSKYFWITLNNLDPAKEYAFQYLVDGSIRIGDPYCEKILDPWNDKYINEKHLIYPELRSYPSDKATDILSVFKPVKASYNWLANDFVQPAQDNLVVYEILLRDFTTEGSVNAAIDKLDYLQKLGINAIELMPIQEFDGNDSWGYNPNFYFAPDKAYGTKADYKRFIDECHQRGIAVILDVVFNHSWGQSPMCKLWWNDLNNQPSKENPYYNEVAPHPYSVGNDFDHSQKIVRDFFKRVLQFWMEEYRVDGFRFDLSKGFTQKVSGDNVELWSQYDKDRIAYIKEYTDAIKSVNPAAYVIMEHFAVESEEDEIAAYKSVLLWRNMNYNFAEAAMGWKDKADLSGIKAFNRIGFMESHDEERIAFKAKEWGNGSIKTDLATRMKQNTVCAAFALLSPGPRMIWQFGEQGYDYSIDYNGRTGRKPVRWDYLEQQERKTLYEQYSLMLNLRKAYPQVFRPATDFNWQVLASDWDGGKRMEYKHPDLHVIVLGNFSNNAIGMNPRFTKTGEWYEVLSGTIRNIAVTTASIQLNPNEVMIFTSEIPTSEEQTDEDIIRFYPNPVKDVLYIETAKEVKKINIYSLSGQLIKQVTGRDKVGLSHLGKGAYIIECFIGERISRKTILKD